MAPVFVFLLVFLIVLVLLLVGLIIMLGKTIPIARRLYFSQWTRPKDALRERRCSDPSIPYHLDMYWRGLHWREAAKKHRKEVSIVRDGLHLYGEYYDYGFSKAVIFLPGRTEDATYGAFYAEPYVKAGFNFLCPDQRSNGLSDGRYITLGREESLDAREWGAWLHAKMGIEEIVIVGLCSGATSGLLIMTAPDKPAYFTRLIADSMYYSFFEVYKRHIQEKKRPVYPIIHEVIALFRREAKVRPGRLACKKIIRKMKDPILLLAGRKDIYAVSAKAAKLYHLCPAKEKKLLYLEARHSHLRYDDQAAYDTAVSAFIAS